MGADLELGNWIVPLLVTVVVFGLALGSVRARAPEYSRLANRIFNLLLVALAAIASLSVWLAWAMVAQ
ncbi:hypothetical protein [Rhizobium leguminosarum]|uniref:hypothetical protein n=1 Tax=Rhizobium leguminosarum TaxID=384 RepID=UPI0013B9BD7C|nr:hypothetical protein [Rhizobium leguminosarum]NEI60932.1 hypothetical protein [Rhizobium leguminosarum]